MMLSKEIELKKEQFVQLCRSHSISRLYAFGSAITDKFNSESDIDLLVEIDEPNPILRGEKLMSLWNELERFFNRKIDLLTESSIINPILRKNIEINKKLIYDGSREKVYI